MHVRAMAKRSAPPSPVSAAAFTFGCSMKAEEADLIQGGALGLSLLMGAAIFSWGYERGCRKAEMLAINDEGGEKQRSENYVSTGVCQPLWLLHAFYEVL